MRNHSLLILSFLGSVAACGPDPTAKPDAGPTGDGDVVVTDAFGGPNFGAPCTTASDCGPRGLCVDGSSGDTCTSTCDAGCPAGWSCRVKEISGELVSVCLPQQYDYCKACADSTQCEGGVCVSLDGVAACLANCPFEGGCPSGYTCGDDPTGANPGRFCVPDSGNCSCTNGEAGQVRTCSTTNANGTCFGLETCNPQAGGWIGCNAASASPESCDGADNNCNQLIDDGVGGAACDITVAGIGTCQGATLCTGAAGEICQGPTPEAEACNYTDDDCDATVDEGYANLGNVCSDGIGGCERFGVIRCTADGAGTACSVTAGAPIAEACNGLDDDCDMRNDESFTTLGTSCSAGTGACARQGNRVCNAAGTGTTCSVTPGTPGAAEACNGLDDDCDMKVDEGFRNQSTMQYDQDTACGSCSTDCTVLFDLPNANGVCSTAMGAAECAMVCEANAFDLDGQTATGCEFALDVAGIYVSTDDPGALDDASCGLGPVGTGAGRHPCLTIAQGIARANTTNRPRVLVANGIYSEPVTIANGRSLLGGHAPDTWERDVASTSTVLEGVAAIPATNHERAVLANGITMVTVFEGFVVLGPVNAKPQGNSYAIHVTVSSTALTIRNNRVFAGRGGPGVDGGIGAGGALGVNGMGRPSSGAGYDARIASGAGTCNVSNNRQHANGGALTCGGDVVNGGNGGGNRCPTATNDTELSGIDGFAGQAGNPTLGGAAGTGADAGDDSRLFAASSLCSDTGDQDYGEDGTAGTSASHGAAVAGCSATGGALVGGHWVAGGGTGGNVGGNGGGGGGGGAGGGGYCESCTELKDKLGGHGGGGGSGGCGGSGGGVATGGGGSFALFIVGGTAPTVANNTILRGEGGVGGRGGAGGAGGPGGVGADGGTSAQFCAGPAGRGGNGGDGGHGSGGGGGCGGGSFAFYTSGIGMPNYCTPAANNATSGGAGGAGGAGGYSIVSVGGAGLSGTLGACTFN